MLGVSSPNPTLASKIQEVLSEPGSPPVLQGLQTLEALFLLALFCLNGLVAQSWIKAPTPGCTCNISPEASQWWQCGHCTGKGYVPLGMVNDKNHYCLLKVAVPSSCLTGDLSRYHQGLTLDQKDPTDLTEAAPNPQG
jgi:hypothetical protein